MQILFYSILKKKFNLFLFTFRTTPIQTVLIFSIQFLKKNNRLINEYFEQSTQCHRPVIRIELIWKQTNQKKISIHTRPTKTLEIVGFISKMFHMQFHQTSNTQYTIHHQQNTIPNTLDILFRSEQTESRKERREINEKLTSQLPQQSKHI